jgi:alkanesulfonate monooxygenase SsuD/methylene tetrahydromethanopterin reductase-like flavin-dependent oxidoreductase (luciferase family)
MVLLRSGRLQEIPTPEQAAAYPYSPAERDLVRGMNATAVIGNPEQVADGLDALVDRFGVKEMLVSTRAHGLHAKLRSMELIAGAYALSGRQVG